MAETIFDKIIAKQIPVTIVYEDEHVLAFRDINPQAPVHVLVIPKVKSKSFVDLEEQSPQLVGEFVTRISKVAKRLGLNDRGYRIIFNCGPDGQQTVDYIHAHIIGGRGMLWPPG